MKKKRGRELSDVEALCLALVEIDLYDHNVIVFWCSVFDVGDGDIPVVAEVVAVHDCAGHVGLGGAVVAVNP